MTYRSGKITGYSLRLPLRVREFPCCNIMFYLNSIDQLIFGTVTLFLFFEVRTEFSGCHGIRPASVLLKALVCSPHLFIEERHKSAFTKCRCNNRANAPELLRYVYISYVVNFNSLVFQLWTA
jgi:hypothetical protein